MKPKNGFVYAITFKNKTKIGRSINPDKRVNAVLSQCGVSRNECEIYIVETGDYYKCEVNSHALLSRFRGVGEWFYVDHANAINAINRNVKPLIKINDMDIDYLERFKSMFSQARHEDDEKIESHMRFYGCVPYTDGSKYFTILPTYEKTDESECIFDYVFKFIHGFISFQIEHDEHACWDFNGIFNSLDARSLGDIAVMEKIVANAVSDGINAGLEYKDIFQLAKNRCKLALPAIGFK